MFRTFNIKNAFKGLFELIILVDLFRNGSMVFIHILLDKPLQTRGNANL